MGQGTAQETAGIQAAAGIENLDTHGKTLSGVFQGLPTEYQSTQIDTFGLLFEPLFYFFPIFQGFTHRRIGEPKCCNTINLPFGNVFNLVDIVKDGK